MRCSHAVARRQDQHRQDRAAAAPAAQPHHAVAARQAQVEHDGVDRARCQRRVRLRAVGEPVDHMAELAQAGGQRVAEQGVVLDDEQAHSLMLDHVPSVAAGRRRGVRQRDDCPMTSPSRTPPASGCGRSRRDRSAPPSRRRCPCRPAGVSSITSASLRHSTPARRARVVVDREAALRLAARHHAPAGAVRARREGLRVALAAHDVRSRAHAARDDAELALAARAPRPCA